MHIPGAEKLVAKLFGGVKPHLLLTPSDLAAAEPLVKDRSRGLWPWILFPWVGIVSVGFAAIYIRDQITGPSLNPALDDRGYWGWMGLAMLAIIAACFCFLVIRPLVLRRRFGPDATVYDCFLATKEGWLPRRSALFFTALSLPIMIMSFITMLSLGACIDDRGMLVTHDQNGLVPHFYPYSEVTSIEQYDQMIAPRGHRHIPNLVVRFTNGRQYNYMPDKNQRIPPVMRLAQYISARANLPVTHGTLRP
jgi:hypothetical protein